MSTPEPERSWVHLARGGVSMSEERTWRLIDERPDRDRYQMEIGGELVAEVYYDEQPDERFGWFWRIEGREGHVSGTAASFEDASEEVQAVLRRPDLAQLLKMEDVQEDDLRS